MMENNQNYEEEQIKLNMIRGLIWSESHLNVYGYFKRKFEKEGLTSIPKNKFRALFGLSHSQEFNELGYFSTFELIKQERRYGDSLITKINNEHWKFIEDKLIEYKEKIEKLIQKAISDNRYVDDLDFGIEIGSDRDVAKNLITYLEIDVSKIPERKPNSIAVVRESIKELENTLGKTIPLDDLFRVASEKEIKQEEVEEAIEKLKRTGDLFEPKSGFISRI